MSRRNLDEKREVLPDHKFCDLVVNKFMKYFIYEVKKIDKKLAKKIKVLSVSELFAIAIRNAYENKSITSLFIHSQRKG